MLDLVTYEVQSSIALARRTAYCRTAMEAVASLNRQSEDPHLSIIDRAALSSVKAELLYLDGQYSAAHGIFDLELDPLLEDLPYSIAVTVECNRVDVASSMFDSEGIQRFYHLADEMRIAGIKHSDDSALRSASGFAAKGKSYESLPAIWRELVRTYRQGRWSAFREVSRYMTEECIRIGEFAEAAYHAANSCDSEMAKGLANVLLTLRRKEAISAVIEKLMTTAHLRAHCKIACTIVQALSDAIPDNLIDDLVKWILPRCGGVAKPEDQGSLEREAWKTVECLAPRCGEETAIAIVACATAHRTWSEVAQAPNHALMLREEIVDALNETVRVIPIDALASLADATIPLATIRRNFKDFENVVYLLAHVASRAPEPVRGSIREHLYPKGKQIPAVLMKLAPRFGQDIQNTNDQLNSFAEIVKSNLGNVVQMVRHGEEPVPVRGTIMTFTSEEVGQRLLVHTITLDDIHAIAWNRKYFGEESLHGVIRALVKCIGNPNDLLDNKICYIDCIREFVDVLNRELAGEIFDVIAPIADGQIEVSPSQPNNEQNPLSRFRINGTSKAQIQGHALFVLGCVESRLPSVFGEKLHSLVETALSSSSPAIRKGAFAAVREIPTISETTWMPLIMGTRDPDTDAASLAFDAIAHKKESRLTRPQWWMLAYSLRTAQLSTSIELRCAAAGAVSALLSDAPSNKIREELEGIRQLFTDDFAFSVRQAAQLDNK